MNETGTVFNIQRFSIQDGPGIRTTVFLKGCPLRCLWCSNPESQASIPEIAHRDSLCTGCGDCVKACERAAITVSPVDKGFKLAVDRQKCDNCGACAGACIMGALKLHGEGMTVDEAFDQARRDIDFYGNSGGGVTASGGEPLSQPDFVAGLFKRCHSIGIHTTIDTSGFAPASALEKVLPETDLILFDLKLMNADQHERFTGLRNETILRNVRMAIEKRVPTIIRIPFIPGVNDSPENMAETARFVCEMDRTLHVDLLPYHRFGEGKYRMLDKDYQLADTKSPAEERLEEALQVFRGHNLDCAIQR